MRTPTQQTLDTRITPTPVATAIPVSKQSGGFSHAHLTMGSPIQPGSYIRRLIESATQPGFDRAFSCLQLFVSPPFSKGLSADEYP